MSELSPLPQRPDRFFYGVTLTGALTALAVFAWRGWYSRYHTDDYCTAGLLQTLGFIEAMTWHREHWSGRFSYFPLKALFESFGSVTTRITPAVMIVLFFVTTFVTLRVLSSRISRLAASAISAGFVFAIVDASPSLTNIAGSLYWETGSVTYLPPLMLFTLWVALFAPQVRARVAYPVSALAMFIAGGFSETSLAAQGAFTGAALLLFLFWRNRHYAWIAAAGFIASLVALFVVSTAPGNAIRARSDVFPREPLEAIVECFRLANDFIGTYLFANGLALLPLAFLAYVCASRTRHADPRTALAVAGIALCGYIAAFLPSSWLLRVGPPERSLDVANFFMIVAVFATASAAGLRARPRTSRTTLPLAMAAVVLLAIPVLSIRENLETIPRVRDIAVRRDAADQVLRESRGKAVALHAPWAVSRRIFSGDPTHWSNVCVSRYYGLQSFHATR